MATMDSLASSSSTLWSAWTTHPHIICFMASEIYGMRGGDHTEWVLMLDMRSKTVISAHRTTLETRGGLGKNLIPSRGLLESYSSY